MKRDLNRCRSIEMADRVLYDKYGYYYACKRFALLSLWMKMNGLRTPYQQFADIREAVRMRAHIDKMDLETIKKISEETVNVEPGENIYRQGRITASACGKYLECYKQSCPDPLVFLQRVYDEKHGLKDYKGLTSQPYIAKCLKHGTDMEDTAKSAFSVKMVKEGKPHKLYKAGFYVDPVVGIFGCTPDGIIELADGTKALLEVKCPYSVAKAKDIKSICTDVKRSPTFELKYDKATDTFSLNLNSFKGRKYNHQMQMSMWVTGMERTYFCVYIFDDVQYILVERDPDWEAFSLPNLCRLYRDFYMDAMGRDICQANIANQEAFDRLADAGLPLNVWPEKVWKVRREKTRRPALQQKKRQAVQKRDRESMLKVRHRQMKAKQGVEFLDG